MDDQTKDMNDSKIEEQFEDQLKDKSLDQEESVENANLSSEENKSEQNNEQEYNEVQLDEEKPPVEDGNSYIIAAFCHLSFFVGLGILGPIVVYLVSDDYFVKDHAKEAMGSQIMFTIGYFLAGILSMILIGLIFIPILFIAQVIWAIKGAKASLHGKYYNYPISSKYVQNL